MYTVAAILSIIQHDDRRIYDEEQEISELAYDSRKIRKGANSLFFALKNVRDGHLFIDDAYRKGVRSFVVSRKDIDFASYGDANFIVVRDTLSALQELAGFHRLQFTKPIIGITGSNGKTIVKEWLTQLLQPDKKVYQSPKSYNSQLGVALSLWNLSAEYDYAIIEAGISRPGEMSVLENMIKPDIGIFTNIGLAHANGFASKDVKLKEKLCLFSNCDTVVFASQYGIRSLLPAPTRKFSYGQEESDSVHILQTYEKGHGKTAIQIAFGEEVATLTVPFQDKASLENALICVTTLLLLGYPLKTVGHRLSALRPLDMRLQLKKGKNNSSIIDDTYSNDLASLQIALEFLYQQRQYKQKTLILSDMEGLNEHLRSKLASLMELQQLDRTILVGKGIFFLEAHIKGEVLLFETTEQLLGALKDMSFGNETILIKGSRAYHLEDVSNLLSAKSHETVLEINLKALEHNLQTYRSMLPPDVRMMAMVKAFSYGSGSYEVANLLQFNKVDYLTVAFADEGAELRQHGIELPIMVLSPDERAFETLVSYQLEPEVYSFRVLYALLHFLTARGIEDFPIHIKIDTGMHRLGFLPEELTKLSEVLQHSRQARVRSVLSHLAAAGSATHKAFTEEQIRLFVDSTAFLRERLGYDFIRHIANTSGIAGWPSAYMDMVRLGIGLYGIDMSGQLSLEAVGQLKTTITQIKELPAGATVGYDRKGVLQRDSRIATIKIGYADGYDRRFGNGVGEMSINGQTVKTVGSICMDMCMLDVTDIFAHEEDEVIVFPDLLKAAETIGTIPYELLVNISSRVKRVYFYD